MKNLLIILIIVAGLTWLNACSSSQEIVKKDGQGGVDASTGFLSKIEGSNPNQPYYFSTNYNWLKNKKLDGYVGSLDNYSADYMKAEAMEDSSFNIFQVDVNNADSVLRVAWIADITREPQLRLLSKDEYPDKTSGETVAGVNEETVKQYIIRAMPMGPWHDEYSDIEDRYAKNTRFVITWDKDAFPDVQYLKQIKERASVFNEVAVAKGDNEAIVDIRKGRYIQLCWKVNGKEINVKVNPYKESDLILDGLVAVPLNKDYWLKIIGTEPQEPVKPAQTETLDKDKTYKFHGIITPLLDLNKKVYKQKTWKRKVQPKKAKIKNRSSRPATPQSYEIHGTIKGDDIVE